MVLVLSGLAPQERREETVSSDADRAADIRGVVPSLVSGCKEAIMMMTKLRIVIIDNLHNCSTEGP